jgi:hypothetical protein
MALIRKTWGRKTEIQLTCCPLCGKDFTENEAVGQHLQTHDPDDAGLSPLGDAHPDADRPTFRPGGPMPYAHVLDEPDPNATVHRTGAAD